MHPNADIPQDLLTSNRSVYSPAVSRLGSASNLELQFTVAAARGGLIVSVRTYDRPREDYIYVNHIIHDNEDAARNIADIVSIELMKL